ncbi:hypothetical protein MMUC44124_17535 [Mycolicibacterium mucogenicum DSM 44124]|nr:hypothetical protein MMUC44124_17535 [Mycolicibacterium mucogenicum DSM 44124]
MMRILTWAAAALIAGAALGFAPATARADTAPSDTTNTHKLEHAAVGNQTQSGRNAPAGANAKHERRPRGSSVESAKRPESKTADRKAASTAPVAVEAVPTPADVSGSGRKVIMRPAKLPARSMPRTPVEAERSAKDSPTSISANTTRTAVPTAQPGSNLALVSAISNTRPTAKVDATAATTPARAPTLLGVVTGLVFGAFTQLERLITGPPTVPPGSSVTVRSSTLQLAAGIVVPADWYYPAGKQPERMVLLQHGFFAIGAMYSDTAAKLAEATDSVVVVPTLTSNPFADGGLWVNGVGMQQAIAQLFVGDRTALTSSAIAAGYARQYGLVAGDATLPTQFALAGHSAGGALVAGAAGYLANNRAADDLVGVLMLDAVTTADQLSSALTKLDAYQQQSGRYIPVREIGSPPNLWNFISNVNATLSRDRPGHLAGVVLSGGVHTDSMGGGSALSQFLVHLVAGVPIKRNSLAVGQLSAQWLNDWFSGEAGADDDLVPGTTVTIATANGPAVGTVIGTPTSVAPTGSVVTAS